MPTDEAAWRKYFYPGTDVLRNKLNIRDADKLSEVEYQITETQADALAEGDLPIEGETSAERLSSIHRSLLGKLYDWAGEYRDVNMTKGGHGFGDHASMGMYMRQLDGAIRRFDWESATEDQKINNLGELHKDLNFAHPFREGNGRTARIFMSDLAAKHGIDLDFEAIDKPTWNEASRATFLDPGGIRMDATPLVELYRQIATPIAPDPAEAVDTQPAASPDPEASVQRSADAFAAKDPFAARDPYKVDPFAASGPQQSPEPSPEGPQQSPTHPERSTQYGPEI